MDHPIDTEYCAPDTETSDANYNPGRTTQLQVDEHPADKTEDFDPYDREHLEFDSQEVSVAATEIETFDVDNPAKWKPLRNINAGIDGHRGREDGKQKVDKNKLDKRQTAQAVACQFGLAPHLREAVVTWVAEADLRGYSRHYGGRLGAISAEVAWHRFDHEHEALDSERFVEKVEDVTGGTKIMTETDDDGTVVREWEEAVDPVDVRGLLLFHFDRRRQA